MLYGFPFSYLLDCKMKTTLSLGTDLLYSGILRDSDSVHFLHAASFPISDREVQGVPGILSALVLPEDLPLHFSCQVRNGVLTCLHPWNIFLKILFYHHILLFWKRLKQELQLQLIW